MSGTETNQVVQHGDKTVSVPQHKRSLMNEKFDLQEMLLEIQNDEAIDIGKATHLSQDQIRELLTRRKTQDTKQYSKPPDTA